MFILLILLFYLKEIKEVKKDLQGKHQIVAYWRNEIYILSFRPS